MTQAIRRSEPDNTCKAIPALTAQALDDMPAREVQERRGRFTKVFSLEGSGCQAVTYAKPIHFRNARTGEWEEIDNTFTAGRYKGRKCLRNRAGEMQVRCMASGQEPFIYLQDAAGNSIAYGVWGAANVFPAAEGGMRANKAGGKAGLLRAQALDRLEGTIRYANIFPDADMVCSAVSGGVKDAVLFRTPASVREVIFCFDAYGAQMALDQDKGMIFVSGAEDQRLFSIPVPFLMDAAGEKGEVKVSLAQEAESGLWRMRCVPDAAFAENAAFPVALDPAIYTQNQSASIEDTYVSSGAVNNTYSDSAYLLVEDQGSSNIRHAYLKVTSLPPIEAANYITKAYLCLSLYSKPSEDTAVFLSEVTAPYTTTGLTYANRPTNNSLYQDYITTLSSAPMTYYYPFDVTSLVRKWYLGENNGVVLTPQPEGSGPVRFHSMQGTRPPYLVVNYNSLAGLEGYLTYDERGLGRAGTSHVSLYNGNLIFTHGDTATSGSLMPVSIGHVYNSCDAQEDYWHMGHGWRTSMHLTLHRETIPDQAGANTTYYVYTDGDGTLHHLKDDGSGTYKDMDGLSLKLTIDTGAGTATITDKGDNRTVFGLPAVDRTNQNYAQATQMVRQISNAQGSTVLVSADGLRILGVQDGAGRTTAFAYNENGRCASIQAPGQSAGNCVRFMYDAGGNLTTITHEDEVASGYTYNANHLLLTAANADGRVIAYTYSNAEAAPGAGLPYRVVEMRLTNGALTDERRGYEYGSRLTVSRNLTYAGGKALTYHFNDYGNLVSVHDELGQASFTAFSQGGLPNHPDAVSRMQRVVTNLLMNPSIEDGTVYWTTGGTGDFLRDQTVFYIGLVSRKITVAAGNEAYCGQTVALTPGSGYTFSAYVKTAGDVRAYLRAQYTEGGVTKTFDSEPYYNLADFTRISLSFTLPYAASGTVTCYLVCNTYAGTAWFDCMQLEKGLVLNRYNLLQNSDFALGGADALPECWEKSDTSSNNWYQPHRPDDQPAFLTGRSVRLTGRHNRSVGFWQKLRAYGSTGDVYVAGGWTRGFGKEFATNANGIDTVRNYIKVFFGSGTDHGSPGGTIHFNQEEGSWQFACGAVKAPRDYTYIWFEIHFYQQMNYADFTNLFLYKEEFGSSYTYDAAGNITDVKTLSGTQGNAEYDAFNNLTSYVQPGRPKTVKTVLDYGATEDDKKKHLLKQSTDPMGVIQAFAYDVKGNPTLSKTQNSGGASFIQGTTAYTENPNYVLSQTDARGKTVTSDTDWDKGTLKSVTDPNGQTVSYTYDALKRITETTAIADGTTYKNQYSYNQDRLAEVRHNTTGNDCDVRYSFTYDAFGKPVNTFVGYQILSSNAYDAVRGTLGSVTYGNGGSVAYIRDDFDRVTGIRYDGEGTDRYSYSYNAEGGVGHVSDQHLNRTHAMEYDAAGRLMRVTTRGEGGHVHTGELAYDTYNNLSAFKEKAGSGSTPYTTTYAYDNGSRPTTVQFGDAGNKVGYGYDALGRLSTRTLTVGGLHYTTTYGFEAGGHGAGSTTALVSSITQPGQNFTYTYDNVGNIASVNLHRDPGIPLQYQTYMVYDGQGSQVFGDAALTQPVFGQVAGTAHEEWKITYQYDKLGQLVRVNDPYDKSAGAGATTWVYSYDRGGNITGKAMYFYTTGALGTPLHTFTYTYDATWKDKLISYKIDAIPYGITYDLIGNPLADGTWTYQWQAGRQLMSMVKSGAAVTFAYNPDGLRIRKTANGTVTDYTLHGKQVVHMTKGGENLHFFYDAQGRPAVVEWNGVKFGYVHNLQGDIVALIDGGGNAVVEYTYDAWGKPLTKIGTLAATLGMLNPFRYRGYVFDEETGLYYLRSRYYNPVWGRFLNADTLLGKRGGLLSHNIFAYCANNVVRYADPSGQNFDNEFGGASGFGGAVLPRPQGLWGSAGEGGFSRGGDGLIGLGSIGVALFKLIQELHKAKSIPHTGTGPQDDLTVIYHTGSATYTSLTPKPGQTDGVSFTLIPPPAGVKYVWTTMEWINDTGVLRAYNDHGKHVCVYPTNGTLAEWAATRANADEKPHEYTVLLSKLVIDPFGRKTNYAK